MKKALLLLLALLLGIIIYWFASDENPEVKFNAEIQKEMSGEGRYTFKGPGDKTFRYWAISDMINALPNRDKIYADQLNVVQKEFTKSINLDSLSPTILPQIDVQFDPPNYQYDNINCDSLNGPVIDCLCNGDGIVNLDPDCEIIGGDNSKCDIIMIWEGMSRCKIINDMYGTKIRSFNITPKNLFDGRLDLGTINVIPDIINFGPNNIQEINLVTCGNNSFNSGQYMIDVVLERPGISQLNISLPMLLGN